MEKIPAKISNPKLYETILGHQTKDLTKWKKKLIAEAYADLEAWATEINDTVIDPYQIRRGMDLDTFVNRWKKETIDELHVKWCDLVDCATHNQVSFRMGDIEVTGTLNALKDMVGDMGISFDTTEPPNYIADFMFAVEAYYQSYYGLDQDCFEKVHGNQDFEIYRKNLAVKK
jgi:hypothetical protein